MQGDDDFLVVHDVVEGEGAVVAVFEPFLGGLVAADVELPGGGGDVVEVLGVVDPDASELLARIGDFPVGGADVTGDGVGAVDGVGGDGGVEGVVLEEVELADLAAELDEVPEGVGAVWVWDSWEVYFEEFFIRLAVGGAVEGGVDVVEEVEGGEGGSLL